MIKEYIQVVKGIQYLGGKTAKEKKIIKDFLNEILYYYDEIDSDLIIIGESEIVSPDEFGNLVVVESDYLLKDENGRIYKVSESDFKKLYKENNL